MCACVTDADTLAATYLSNVSTTAGSVAKGVALIRNGNKYSANAQSYVLIPLAIENPWPINITRD